MPYNCSHDDALSFFSSISLICFIFLFNPRSLISFIVFVPIKSFLLHSHQLKIIFLFCCYHSSLIIFISFLYGLHPFYCYFLTSKMLLDIKILLINIVQNLEFYAWIHFLWISSWLQLNIFQIFFVPFLDHFFNYFWSFFLLISSNILSSF